MIAVLDRYADGTDELKETVCRIAPNTKIAVLGDAPFAPHDVLPLYDYFIYGQERGTLKERRLHFNFLPVPEFWEIRMDGLHGAIYDMSCKKANIYFIPDSHDLQRVEWCMEDGWVYRIDYYNQYALKYASEFLDADGNVESKVFYSRKNQEVVVEQPQNDTVTLLERGQVKAFFTSRAQFIEHFLREIGPENERRILFVQHPDGLGPAALQLDGKSIWDRVLFSNNELLERYTGMGGQNVDLFYAIPKEYPENLAKGEALTLTASDQLEEIEYLIHALPELTFHIAANTQVSDKLRRLGEQPNVKVYPQISQSDLNALWERCDFYLDINHYGEIFNAIDLASQKNLLILGFQNTAHCWHLVEEACIFPPAEKENLAAVLKKLVGRPVLMQYLLARQQAKKQALWENLREML